MNANQSLTINLTSYTHMHTHASSLSDNQMTLTY